MICLISDEVIQALREQHLLRVMIVRASLSKSVRALAVVIYLLFLHVKIIYLYSYSLEGRLEMLIEFNQHNTVVNFNISVTRMIKCAFHYLWFFILSYGKFVDVSKLELNKSCHIRNH